MLKKVIYENNHTVISAENLNDIQDAILVLEDGLFSVDNDKSGEVITITDAANRGFRSLRIFGRTTHYGTPTLSSAADLVDAVYSGVFTVNVTGENKAQHMTIITPKPGGLPGIPVADGGNYTDENGQQWVCDEIDLARGVYVQRVHKYEFTGDEDFVKNGQPGNYYLWKDTLARKNDGNLVLSGALCNRLVEKVPDRLWDTIGDGFAVSTVTPYCVHFRFESIPTVDALKIQLAEWYNNDIPLTILFELETPTETPLPKEELAAYAALRTYKDNTTVSNDASAHMELEYVMDAKKYIESIVGGGSSARLGSVTIKASAWVTEADGLHSQVVTIAGVTPYSKVDLLPSVEQLAVFHNKDVAFVTENEDGVVTVFAIGDKPTMDYTMQISITEVTV